MRRSLLSWTVDVDGEATAALYGALQEGCARRCGCPSCADFDRARPAFFPDKLRALLSDLRIDPLKETTVRLVSPLEGSRNLYAGAYGFCGVLLAGRPFRGFPSAREEVDVFEAVGADAQVALKPWSRPPVPWSDGSTVRLEFLVVLPRLRPGGAGRSPPGGASLSS